MVPKDEGLTKTYNRFRNPGERDPDIVRPRGLHAAMDRAVLDADSWGDIPCAPLSTARSRRRFAVKPGSTTGSVGLSSQEGYSESCRLLPQRGCANGLIGP